MPVYNERATLRAVIERVLAVPLDIELLCVDDGSKDGSREILSGLQSNIRKSKSFCSRRVWKGAAAAGYSGSYKAISSSFKTPIWNTIRGISVLLEPLLEAKRTLCMDRGFLGGGPHRVLYFWHSVGNSFLTLLSNCLTNINLSDMKLLQGFSQGISSPFRSKRTARIRAEITVKIAKRRLRIYEVGIGYWGRTRRRQENLMERRSPGAVVFG